MLHQVNRLGVGVCRRVNRRSISRTGRPRLREFTHGPAQKRACHQREAFAISGLTTVLWWARRLQMRSFV
jgi:hypothetical protein